MIKFHACNIQQEYYRRLFYLVFGFIDESLEDEKGSELWMLANFLWICLLKKLGSGIHCMLLVGRWVSRNYVEGTNEWIGLPFELGNCSDWFDLEINLRCKYGEGTSLVFCECLAVCRCAEGSTDFIQTVTCFVISIQCFHSKMFSVVRKVYTAIQSCGVGGAVMAVDKTRNLLTTLCISLPYLDCFSRWSQD